jgi:superfamily II DNA/RNA helicase
VAPFRALCHEIRNSLAKAFSGEPVNVDELSDIFQADFNVGALLRGRQVLVVTPEKLVYVLRHNPELATNIGLLIYDEGHQFDNGTRGVTYELLVTSLKALVPKDAQTVLVSAVISNAEAINGWLNGEDSVVISGTTLSPTYRSVAFASWRDTLGRLEFVAEKDPDQHEFFVPRVIQRMQLDKKTRERTRRVFPTKGDSPSIALYLAIKLIPSGSVAVFCGRKDTAASICEMAVDVYDRNAPLEKPVEHSGPAEVRRLTFLHERNLGDDAASSGSARLGIFAHHNNTPHGIRLAIEHAMKEGLVRCVVCTSTLAQGVNLPIRYLIVTSTKQGSSDRIKVRDFHNLIGRAGRSGMHTEGSILFANSDIYDDRKVETEAWRWTEIKELLQPANAEPCASTLLSVFEPFHSDNRRRSLSMEPLQFARAYITGPAQIDDLPSSIAARLADRGYSERGLTEQIAYKRNIIAAIESYLMAYWDESQSESGEVRAAELARGTLAYHLAAGDETTRGHLVELFTMLARNIATTVPDMGRRKVFGKTLYGVTDSLTIEKWVTENVGRLSACETQEELLTALWPILARTIRNSLFKRCNPAEILQAVAEGWIEGRPYHELFQIVSEANVRFGTGPRARYARLEHVVDICENALAYDGMLTMGAVTEIYGLLRPDDHDTLGILLKLQKRMKYGLPSPLTVILYELGFADRVIAIELSEVVGAGSSRRRVIGQLKQKVGRVREVLEKYPSYFHKILTTVLK